MCLNLIPTPKIAPKNQKVAPKGPNKVQKRPKMWPNSKQKVRAVPPKPKLIVYIGRSQKVFELDPNPKNSFKDSKSAKKAPIVAELKTQRYGRTFKTIVDCLHR